MPNSAWRGRGLIRRPAGLEVLQRGKVDISGGPVVEAMPRFTELAGHRSGRSPFSSARVTRSSSFPLAAPRHAAPAGTPRRLAAGSRPPPSGVDCARSSPEIRSPLAVYWRLARELATYGRTTSSRD